ncbi:hypothetical protein ACA910_005148 [Epithemia clementina (nom. ined.)]
MISCVAHARCPAPMYYCHGNTYFGVYSNHANEAPVITNKEDFGLEVYETEYFHPIHKWAGAGNHSIQLMFNDASYSQDIFTFVM